MHYILVLKYVHVSSVLLSISGFVVRGIWMMQGSPRLNARWVRIAPHVVDTVLLVSAVWLAFAIHQYPFVHGWLTAKVVGLVAYIALGMIALRRGRTRGVRIAAFVAAIAVFAYIVAVAVTHTPAPGLG
jgi:uncharacterized membrane protein SirB2